MLESLRPNFAWAQQGGWDDSRIKSEYVSYPSPRGSDTTRGYLVRAAKAGGKLPGMLVIHENRGLNPYVEDVGRRLAVEGYFAFAPDALAPVGGYPGDEDKARAMSAKLARSRTLAFFKEHLKTRQRNYRATDSGVGQHHMEDRGVDAHRLTQPAVDHDGYAVAVTGEASEKLLDLCCFGTVQGFDTQNERRA